MMDAAVSAHAQHTVRVLMLVESVLKVVLVFYYNQLPVSYM